MPKSFKVLNFMIAPLALLLAFYLFAPNLDTTKVWQQLRSSEPLLIAAAFSAILVNLFLSTARFGLLKRAFGSTDGWKFIHRLNILSTLYALVGMPLVMQIAGRVFHGLEASRHFYASITIVEKLFSFLLMLSLAAFSSVAYLNQSIIEISFLSSLTLIFFAMSGCFALSATLFVEKKYIEKFKVFFVELLKMRVLTTLFFTIFMQASILSAHVLLAYQFMEEANILTLFGAFSIVVLATTLPVGFGGIGVREVTAGAVFASFGLPIEVGVISAGLYNILFFTSVGLNFIVFRNSRNVPVVKATQSLSFDKNSLWQIAGLTSLSALCFQIRVPLADGIITLNSADLLAILIAGSIMAVSFRHSERTLFWQSPLMWPGLISFAAMVALGWLIGWIKFGSNEWAIANRLLGLISIFSFLITGFALRRNIKNIELPQIFIFSASCYVLSSTLVVILSSYIPLNVATYFNWSDSLSGFVGDRNAYAFLGLMIMISLYFCNQFVGDFRKHELLTSILTGIIMGLIFVSGSRSGMGGIIVMILCWAFFRRNMLFQILFSLILTLIFFFLLIECLSLIREISFDISSYNGQPSTGYTLIFLSGRGMEDATEISSLRLMTWAEGIRLFVENPFIGAGLGAAIENIDIVIHNVFLWIAGEMGLMGIILCLPLSTALLHQTFIKKEPYLAVNRQSLFAFILVSGGFFLVQDIIYQRSFWLLLGFLCAWPVLNQDEK